MLNCITMGNDTALPPLLIAHGLFGSARNWGAIQRRLSSDRRVVAVDMRNHGLSAWYGSHRYVDMARDLAAVIEHTGEVFDVLGHSMGGKAVMMLALTRPELLSRLVVVDIAPVSYGHSNRALVEAMLALPLEGLVSRSEADRRLAGSVADPTLRAFLLQSLDLRVQPARWRLNLEALERAREQISAWPEDAAGQFAGSTLFLSGEHSDYIRSEHLEAIRRFFPAARVSTISGAGHWPHAEQPGKLVQIVREFLV